MTATAILGAVTNAGAVSVAGARRGGCRLLAAPSPHPARRQHPAAAPTPIAVRPGLAAQASLVPQAGRTQSRGVPQPVPWLRTELARRLGVTLLLIVLARVGHFIPLPGMEAAATGSRAAMEVLMGASEVAASVFVLGIAPLMSAFFFLAIANVVPPIRKHFALLREAGPRGRDEYNSYMSALFIVFAGYEAISLARGWLGEQTVATAAGQAASAASTAAAAAAAAAAPAVEAAGGGLLGWASVAWGALLSWVAGAWAALPALPARAWSGLLGWPGWAWGGLVGWTSQASVVLWAASVMTAGAAIVKHITQTVEQHGLGDGTGLIIALGVASNYAHYLQGLLLHLVANPPSPLGALTVAALCAGLVATSLAMQATQLQLPITFFRTKQSRSNQSDLRYNHPLIQLLSGKSASDNNQAQPADEERRQLYFPMQLSPSGARSLLFANFWVALLRVPFSWIGMPNVLDSAIGFALLVLAVESVTFADMTPRQISQYLAGSDAGIKGVSPGEATIKFLTAKRRQLKLINAVALAVLSLASRGVDAASTRLVGLPIGCLSLLLLASTVASSIRQVAALARAPLIERLVAREEAAAGWRNGLHVIMPEKQQQ